MPCLKGHQVVIPLRIFAAIWQVAHSLASGANGHHSLS
jgi:hypothetical protein